MEPLRATAERLDLQRFNSVIKLLLSFKKKKKRSRIFHHQEVEKRKKKTQLNGHQGVLLKSLLAEGGLTDVSQLAPQTAVPAAAHLSVVCLLKGKIKNRIQTVSEACTSKHSTHTNTVL